MGAPKTLLEKPDSKQTVVENSHTYNTALAQKPPANGASASIRVQIAMISGGTHSFEVNPSRRLSDVKEMIRDELAHPTATQKLLLCCVPLLDSGATLHDLGIVDGAILTLVVSTEPMGQHLLDKPSGKKGQHDA